MTTHPFRRPGPVARPPATAGGKIAVDKPIPAPIPPPRGLWGIVLPVLLVVGVIGIIVAMYASGLRSLASGVGIFGIMMVIGMAGMLFRGRGAAQKMSWGELTQHRAMSFSRLDDIRDEVQVQRRAQFEHREHFHWEPDKLVAAIGTERMWERSPSSDEFGEVRVGIGTVKLAMIIEKPDVPEPSQIEPATGHALRKFLLEQEYIDDMAKVIWLQRFAGMSFVGDMDQARGLMRAMLCQLAAFHSPADLQILVVSSAPMLWEWAKWLPHMQHQSQRDGCGERRLLFSSPAELEEFLDSAEVPRSEWAPPATGMYGETNTVSPFRIIVDDHCGTPEDWAGLTGSSGYAGTCFVRLAPSVPPPAPSDVFSTKTWVGFSEETTYRLVDGVLRKRMPAEDLTKLSGAQHVSSDELDDAFYAKADYLSYAAAERFARAMSRFRGTAGSAAAINESTSQRTLLDALGIRDPRNLDVDRLWSARRSQGPEWMRFPVGLDESGQVVELDLKEGSQQGMGMHSLFIGTTGAGKSEGIITEVAALALTHSPEVANVVFFDFKLKSAAGVLEQFPHVVASVSNLGDERHLVGRMYEALEGELDRRGALCNAVGPDVVDLNVYNQRRLTDPSLPPVPVMWVIADEYQELLSDKEWGDKFRNLFWRIMRQGRAYHMFLQLVGQTLDTQKLRDIRKLLGFTIAGRTGTDEDSREAIGSAIAARIDEKGAEGTAYLRIAQRQPRPYRFFYSSGKFVPQTGPDNSRPLEAGTWFEPRPFTAGEAFDVDGLLAEPVGRDDAPVVAAPTEESVTIIDAVIESLQATGAAPPRDLWLPPLGAPPAADDLVARLRGGKPWNVDYGQNPGLILPVGLEDRPREHRQSVCYLNLLESNALIVGASGRGHTTAVMTMVTAAALMYRPERVQFYCIAASGPKLSRLEELPHVASVAAIQDSEGVARLMATVEAIVEERERLFATRGLDMEQVRAAKFGPNPTDIGVAGGDVVLVVDGWAKFNEDQKLSKRFIELQRASNYGLRTLVTHTSYLSNIPTPVKTLSTERFELRMTDTRESELGRQNTAVNRGNEVPDNPGHGLSQAGFHIMVGEPVLANDPGGRVEDRAVGAVVRQVAGVDKAAEVKRLPEKVTLSDVLARVNGGAQQDLVPFGLSESNLGPAFLDFAENPHAVVVGRAQSGRTAFLRTVMHSIMAHYSPDEATIVLIDPRRRHLGVVPDETWLSRYAYTRDDIARAAAELCELFDRRTPPPGTSTAEMLSRQFWTGRKIFIVVDDATSWNSAENPLLKLASYVEQADQLGMHIVAAADIKLWSFQSSGNSVLGRLAGGLQPTIVLDGRRTDGPVISGVYAEPQRQGKGIFVQPASTDGVLVAWTPEPVRERATTRRPAGQN